MTLEQQLGGGDGEVRKVLVIDGVELKIIDQVFHVRRFDLGDPVLAEDDRHPSDEVVWVRDVGEDVVREQHIGLLSLGPQAGREVGRKELLQCWDADRLGRSGRTDGRIDPQDRDPGLGEVLE